MRIPLEGGPNLGRVESIKKDDSTDSNAHIETRKVENNSKVKSEVYYSTGDGSYMIDVDEPGGGTSSIKLWGFGEEGALRLQNFTVNAIKNAEEIEKKLGISQEELSATRQEKKIQRIVQGEDVGETYRSEATRIEEDGVAEYVSDEISKYVIAINRVSHFEYKYGDNE